jgi:hypothetical protein
MPTLCEWAAFLNILPKEGPAAALPGSAIVLKA